jgi:hypothetical protein
MIPTIPAVMNAFEVAVGARITALPATGKSSRSDPSQGEGRAAFGRGALIREGEHQWRAMWLLQRAGPVKRSFPPIFPQFGR